MDIPPSYLPPPAGKGDPWIQIYADPTLHISTGSTTSVKRIASPTSVEQVYLRLPYAPDHEFFGYVTKSQIAYGIGYATWAPKVGGKACVFHSHPTAARGADVPSPLDIYSFLKYPVRRSITVGAEYIWWWDKDRMLVDLVRRLLAWEQEHMLKVCREIADGGNITGRYPTIALAALGFKTSELRGSPREWPKSLRKGLRLETHFLEIDSRRRARPQ